jgi:PAS domain-containing protein
MKHKESSTLNPDPNTGGDNDRKNVFHNQAGMQLQLLKREVEQSNESIIIMTAQLDPPGSQIVHLNPTFTKMTGYAPEDAIGKTPHIVTVQVIVNNRRSLWSAAAWRRYGSQPGSCGNDRRERIDHPIL